VACSATMRVGLTWIITVAAIHKDDASTQHPLLWPRLTLFQMRSTHKRPASTQEIHQECEALHVTSAPNWIDMALQHHRQYHGPGVCCVLCEMVPGSTAYVGVISYLGVIIQYLTVFPRLAFDPPT
jgi:hypothetical protein